MLSFSSLLLLLFCTCRITTVCGNENRTYRKRERHDRFVEMKKGTGSHACHVVTYSSWRHVLVLLLAYWLVADPVGRNRWSNEKKEDDDDASWSGSSLPLRMVWMVASRLLPSHDHPASSPTTETTRHSPKGVKRPPQETTNVVVVGTTTTLRNDP